MAAFAYQALDATGRTRSGVLQADTARAARGQLRDQGLTPLAVEPVREGAPAPGAAGVPRWRRGLSRAQLALLARQLATLVGAGLPMDEALQALGEQVEEGETRALVLQLRSRVMEGQSLAAALGEFPDSFPELFRATVAAGESSGQLARALDRLAEYAERRDALARTLWGALAYPLLLTAVALAVVTGLLVYVVPQVVAVFDNLGQALPWPTRVLIALAAAVREFGLLAVLALTAGAAGLRVGLRREAVRAARDRVLLSLPLFGRLVRAADTANAARTLATLTGSGVPVLEAMQMAAATVGRLPLQQALRRAAARVREGAGIARALAESGQFPPVAVRLIASGEKSGRLEEMLEQAATHQAGEVERRVATVTALLGPLVILMVGGLVLFIVLAILLPIFELNQLIR